MNDWQRSFQRRLEVAKKHWLHRFEEMASEHIEPVFGEFEKFTTGQGLNTTEPSCEPGTRLFKFGLTENGYLLLTFRMSRLDAIEAFAETVLPGADGPQSTSEQVSICDADRAWAQRCFETALDRFIVAFGEAGTADAARAEETAVA